MTLNPTGTATRTGFQIFADNQQLPAGVGGQPAGNNAPATTTSTTSSTSSSDTETAQATVTAPPSSSGVPASNSSSSHGNGGMIGGVVGGVVGALLILTAIFLFCRRRRKQQKAREQRADGNWKSISGDNSPNSAVNGHDHNTQAQAQAPTSGTPVDAPNSATQLLANNNPQTALTNDPATTTINPILELPASIPGQTHSGFTPELPDTGFYRQRAELATHPQTELINVPLHQRPNPSRAPPQYGMIQNDRCLDSSVSVPHELQMQMQMQMQDGRLVNTGHGDSDDKRLIEVNLYQPTPVPIPPPRRAVVPPLDVTSVETGVPVRAPRRVVDGCEIEGPRPRDGGVDCGSFVAGCWDDEERREERTRYRENRRRNDGLGIQGVWMPE